MRLFEVKLAATQISSIQWKSYNLSSYEVTASQQKFCFFITSHKSDKNDFPKTHNRGQPGDSWSEIRKEGQIWFYFDFHQNLSFLSNLNFKF